LQIKELFITLLVWDFNLQCILYPETGPYVSHRNWSCSWALCNHQNNNCQLHVNVTVTTIQVRQLLYFCNSVLVVSQEWSWWRSFYSIPLQELEWSISVPVCSSTVYKHKILYQWQAIKLAQYLIVVDTDRAGLANYIMNQYPMIDSCS
jgi:hypothetical protein